MRGVANTGILRWSHDFGKGRAAAGHEAVTPVRFAYQTVAGCPDQGAFLAMIAKDGARVVPSDDASQRLIDVGLSGAGPFAGQLRIQSAGGGEAARIVAGQRCAGVARAVALLVAIALQDATSEQPDVPSVTPPEPISPEPSESTTAATEATAPTEYAHDPWPPPSPETPPSPPADATRDSASTPLSQRRGWHLAVSAVGGLSSEEGPLLRPNVVAYVEVFLNRAG